MRWRRSAPHDLGDASLYLWSRGAHGAVGLDIESASSEWLLRKLLVELAPKK